MVSISISGQGSLPEGLVNIWLANKWSTENFGVTYFAQESWKHRGHFQQFETKIFVLKPDPLYIATIIRGFQRNFFFALDG